MKARDIVGKRVKRVRQTRVAPGGHREMVTNLDWIEFEDGTLLSFSVAEGESEHYVEGTVRKEKP